MKHLFRMAVLCSLLFSCTDEFTEFSELSRVSPEDSEMVRISKGFLEENRNVLSLPVLGTSSSAGMSRTRSLHSLNYSPQAAPLWGKAMVKQHDGVENLFVPLTRHEELHSVVRLRQGNDVKYQFSNTSSKLLVRKRGEQVMAHVLTYMPDSRYISKHPSLLDTLGMDFRGTDYTGLLLVSSLGGTVYHGYVYKDGNITHRIAPAAHVHHDDGDENGHVCDHSHADNSDSHVAMELFSPVKATRGIGDNFDLPGTVCSICGKWVDDCSCWTCEGYYIYCDSCGMLMGFCICSSPNFCPLCGKEPCVCWDNGLKYCFVCGCSPCQCFGGEGDDKPDEGGGESGGEGGSNGDQSSTTNNPATELFYQSPYNAELWEEVNELLKDIMDDCMGESLYTELLRKNGRLSLVIDENRGYSSFVNNTITLGEVESGQLFQELWHAYQYTGESDASWNKSFINQEIEANYAMYLYLSKQEGYEGSKWERDWAGAARLDAVAGLKIYLDSKGNLLPDKTNTELDFVVSSVASFFESSLGYDDPNIYKYDWERTGLDNFKNLRELTINCI
ncbi:hypothetical protein [Bacteroides sp. UBA939]|uniref:hypothetical protein n=1 Tax=Bacteroides sp. UBA939 TaxID=1946092 RepID=UPI0025C3E968|nr:hypothetical protein [Bacteroides sp. UBA939]